MSLIAGSASAATGGNDNRHISATTTVEPAATGAGPAPAAATGRSLHRRRLYDLTRRVQPSRLSATARHTAGAVRRRVRSRLKAVRRHARDRLRSWVLDQYALIHYEDWRTWGENTRWLGTKVQKLPADLWIYQEILHELRPDLIIETGTLRGGSALYLATICDALGHGQIVTIDIKHRSGLPQHPRIEYVTASSVDSGVIDDLMARAEGVERVLVVLDSDHSFDHVLDELLAYGPMVTPGSYIIVEDTNMNGHPVKPDHGPGPMEAVKTFLALDSRFQVDESREKFLHTFNPNGYLKRVG
jgi:cephalosporin hydroxylase